MEASIWHVGSALWAVTQVFLIQFKVEASIVDQVNFTAHYGHVNVNMDEIDSF